MRDNEQRGRLFQDVFERAAEVLRIEGGEALIEGHEIRPLEQRPGDVEATALAVAELPARLPHRLLQPRRHAVEERAEAESPTYPVRVLQVALARRPATAHEDVERERPDEDVVVVELRDDDHAPPPAGPPDGLEVETREEKKAGVRRAACREEHPEGRLAAPGGTFEEGPSRRMRSPA